MFTVNRGSPEWVRLSCALPPPPEGGGFRARLWVTGVLDLRPFWEDMSKLLVAGKALRERVQA
jgi:hypothetical protein